MCRVRIFVSRRALFPLILSPGFHAFLFSIAESARVSFNVAYILN